MGTRLCKLVSPELRSWRTDHGEMISGRGVARAKDDCHKCRRPVVCVSRETVYGGSLYLMGRVAGGQTQSDTIEPVFPRRNVADVVGDEL